MEGIASVQQPSLQGYRREWWQGRKTGADQRTRYREVKVVASMRE